MARIQAKQMLEARFMTQSFPSPSSDLWYDSISLPSSWTLVGELEDKLLLDLGAASGWIGYHARKQGAKVVACDIFSTMIHPDLVFVLADKENLPFCNETFDVVLTANVLHHGDLRKTTNEIHRVLKPKGTFVSLQEPCIDSDEDNYLNLYCREEVSLGIQERRPSMIEYKESCNIFSDVEFYEMNGDIFHTTSKLIPFSGESYHGGIAIKVVR